MFRLPLDGLTMQCPPDRWLADVSHEYIDWDWRVEDAWTDVCHRVTTVRPRGFGVRVFVLL